MNALIAVNAYATNVSQRAQAERIAVELKALGVSVTVNKNFNLARIIKGKVLCDKYDFCLFLDKDRVAARLLERAGLKLFNSAAAIEVCDDKMLTNITLANAGFPLPDCVYAPLCYSSNSYINEDFLRSTGGQLGFPLVAKINYGSLGAGVTLIKNYDELCAYERANLTVPHFYQQFIDCGGGIDTRVIVVGERVVCAMKRRNENDFRSNIELGGVGEKVNCDSELAKLCTGVARRLGLDYCGVDILTDKSGNRFVCEVNSNAFFAAAERVCNVNVARSYAEYMVGKVKKI